MTLLLAILLVATPPSADQVLGKPEATPLSGPILDQRTNEVSALLRCPVCQGLSVADSPASMALNMKRQVRELLAWGYTEQQILSYFEKSYGEFVRLEPPRRGINWLVWIGPLLALAAGALLVAYTIRRSRVPRRVAEAEPEADPYLERVRELSGETPEQRR